MRPTSTRRSQSRQRHNRGGKPLNISPETVQTNRASSVRFEKTVRYLLENKYVFEPFWSFHNGVPQTEPWEDRFERSRKRADYAMKNRETNVILSMVFDRIYVLRNQIMHGGATWDGNLNREQLGDGRDILAFLIPIFVDLMMDNPNADWGAPHYPVVNE